MPNQFVVLPCQDKICRLATTLPLQMLPDVTQYQRQFPSSHGFVNFACPHCGLGSVHYVADLKPIQALSVTSLVRPRLYRATMKCDEKRCESPVIVHTTIQSEDETVKRTIEARNWRVATLECRDGHRAKQPTEFLSGHVF